MCENADMGIKWPQRYTLIFEGDGRIDMRYVCQKNVKKILMQQARTIYWKKWAANHEYEELKEGIWLEPALGFAAQENKRKLVGNHRNVARNWVWEGGWVQQRLVDIGWSDESECQACHKEEGTEKHRLYHCAECHEIRREIPKTFRKWEQKARTSKRYCNASESEKHKSWGIPAEGFKNHVATDGSLLGTAGIGEHVAGQWCRWIMMKNWGLCMECTAQWMQHLRSSSPSRGRS